MSDLSAHLRNQADMLYETDYPERTAKLRLAADELDAQAQTIERLTDEIALCYGTLESRDRNIRTLAEYNIECEATIERLTRERDAAVKDAEKFQSLVNMRRFMLARKAEITESDRKSYSTSFWDAELSGHEYAVWTALDSAISATTDGGKT